MAASKRGRPPKTDIDRLQAKLWFSAVSEVSGKNASQLEVMFTELITRSKVVSLNELSHGWHKYANGERLPRDSGRENHGIVGLVESNYPGTADWFRSPVWQLLRNEKVKIDEAVKIIKGVDGGIYELFDFCDFEASRPISISIINWMCLRENRSFSAFGVMLLYCRAVGYECYLTSVRIRSCRRWLHDAYHRCPWVRSNRDEIVAVLERHAPELGDLKYLGVETPDESFDEFVEKYFMSGF